MLNAAPGEAMRVLAHAEAGDTVLLASGIHRGPLKILRTLTLRGARGAVVDGGQAGSAIEVFAPRVVVENLAVRGSGRDVMNVDAGVHVASAPDVVLRRLALDDVLYGIYGERAHRLRVEDCRLRGRVTPRQETGDGNGIHLWYCDSVRVMGCEGQRFLDCIYLSFTGNALIRGDRLFDCGRYGLHTMYCQGTHLIGNTFTRNVAGCAIMFSNHLLIEGNDFVHNRGSRTYGLLLRDCSDGTFADNRMIDNTIAVFMDNSNRNRFHSNLVEDNGWGLLLFSSCADNQFAGNNFIQNDYPVALDMKYTRNRFDDGETGNYWSENAPYDLNGDAVSDVPFTPVSAFAFVSKQYPDLTVLAKSPAVAALGVAERVFPSLRPSEAVDHFPRVAPVPTRAAGASAASVPPARPAWAAFAGFVLLSGLGVLGIATARRT